MEKITRAVVEGLKADIQELTEERDAATEKFTQVSKGFKDVQKERDELLIKITRIENKSENYRSRAITAESDLSKTASKLETKSDDLARALGYIDRVNEDRQQPSPIDQFAPTFQSTIGPKLSTSNY